MRHWLLVGVLAFVACGDDAGVDDDGEMVTADAGAGRDARVVGDARAPTQDARTDASQANDASVVAVQDGSVSDAATGDARVGDASTPSGSASWLIKPGDKVFFVGNSFFGWQDRPLYDWVEAIGQAVTPKFAIETGSHIQFGDMPLSWFLEQKESKDAIASGQYDLFILQGHELEPINNKDDFFQAVRDYHTAITAKGGKVMLFMTWDWKWSGGPDSNDYKALSAAYDEIGEELNIPVIPVGTLYNDSEKSPFPGKDKWFLTGDDLHPTVEGSAVNAYATFGMLTGIDAMGVAFDAQNNTNNADMLKYCSNLAWPRVMERLHN